MPYINIGGAPGADFDNEKRCIETYIALTEQVIKRIKKAK